MEALAAEIRRELVETVSEVDDKLADAFLTDEPISSSDLEVYLETKNVFLKENNIHEL
jgi:elongation factor G